MRLVYLSIMLFINCQFSLAQLPNAQPPLFPLTWLQDCTNYFVPLWTEFIPNESKCQKRPRKTYTRRGWDFEGFEYTLGIQELELHHTRTILHFAKPHEIPHETIFLGYLYASQDSFRYHFDQQSRQSNHYFYFLSETPSLATVKIEQRFSSNGRKLLSTGYKTQLLQNCNAWEGMRQLFQEVDTTCQISRDPCDYIIDYSEDVTPNYPNFPRPWIEDCTEYFSPLWTDIMQQVPCLEEYREFADLAFDEDYHFRFPISTPTSIHHFFTDNSDEDQILKHKRSDDYQNTFSYTFKTKSDKRRTHYFYIVGDQPSIVQVKIEELSFDRVKYTAHFRRFCQASELQQSYTKGLTGYCPNDPNICHPFEQKEKKTQLPYKEFKFQDRTCNVAVGADYLTILIPYTQLLNCQAKGHLIHAPDGKFQFVQRMKYPQGYAFWFTTDPQYLTTENLLQARILIAL